MPAAEGGVLGSSITSSAGLVGSPPLAIHGRYRQL